MGCKSSKSATISDFKSGEQIGGVRAKTPRLHPLSIESFSAEVKTSLDNLPADSFKNKFAPMNVFGTIAQSDKIAASLFEHWSKSKKLSSLSNREQEIVILRMAFHYRSDYVWKHHRIIAAEFGVNEAELIALQNLPFLPPSTFSERESNLIRFTDEFNTIRTLSNEAWLQGGKYFKQSELIDVILVISHYVFFALVNNSVCVEIEPAFDNIEGLQ